MVADRTIDAVGHQIRAMGCQKFEIGIRDSKTGLIMNREWTPDQVVKSVPWLKRMNARGNDIYIRPAKSDQNAMVLVDDLDALTVDEMWEKGHKPCCVVETSPKNLQAWIKIGPEALSEPQKTTIAKTLARQYGGDPRSADFRHYGRLSGFTNRKPKHENRYGEQPYCLLRHSSGEFAPKGPELIQQADRVIESQELEAEKKRRTEAIRKQEPQKFAPKYPWDRKASNEYAVEIQKAMDRYGDRFDASAADFRAAKTLLRKGCPPDILKKTMIEASPGITSRKAGHIQDYVDRTVNKALNSITPGGGPTGLATDTSFKMGG